MVMRLQRLEVLVIRLDSSFLPLPGASGLAMRPPPVESTVAVASWRVRIRSSRIPYL